MKREEEAAPVSGASEGRLRISKIDKAEAEAVEVAAGVLVGILSVG